MQICQTHLQHLTLWLWGGLRWGIPVNLQLQPALKTPPQKQLLLPQKPVETVCLAQPCLCNTVTGSVQITSLQLRGTNAPHCIANHHGIDLMSCCHDLALPWKETMAPES